MTTAEFAMAQLRYARNAPQTARRRATLRWATANSNRGNSMKESKQQENSVYTKQLTLPSNRALPPA
jgi:hypothetical protein